MWIFDNLNFSFVSTSETGSWVQDECVAAVKLTQKLCGSAQNGHGDDLIHDFSTKYNIFTKQQYKLLASFTVQKFVLETQQPFALVDWSVTRRPYCFGSAVSVLRGRDSTHND